MNAIKNICFAILVLVLTGCSEDTIGEQITGTITGTIVSEATGEPLANVEISTSPSTSNVLTDSNGSFILENVLIDTYSVKAQLEGYTTAFQSVTVTRNTISNANIELSKSTTKNRQPSAPVGIAPEDNATDLDIEVDFAWDSEDPDEDELTYELEIKNDQNDEVLVFSEIKDTTYTVKNLNFGVKYFWQVKVSDSVTQTVYGGVQSFTTKPVPANNYSFVRQKGENNVVFATNDEGVELQLTSDGKNSFRPRKNLDVNRIAFYRIVGGAVHLFTMDPDGRNQKQITNTIPAKGIDYETLGFSWADNGKALLFPNFGKLYKINTDGSGIEVVYTAPAGRYIMDVQQSEDRSKILVLETNLEGYDGSLFILNNNNGVKEKVIVDGVKGALGGIDISIENNAVLYTRDVSEYQNPNGRQLNSKIFIYKLDSDNTVELSSEKENGTNDTDPRFSPNEAAIIFVNTSNEAGAIPSIYTMEFDEGFESGQDERTQLIENAKMPDWE